ncbi:MAG: SPOR domain-containing protein [Spirochaetales bacterium]
MEQNRILLIIVSVALFLASLLGVGLWLFYPRGAATQPSPVATTNTSPDFDPIEWVRTKEDYPQLQPKPEEKKEEVVILYGEKPADKQTVPETPAQPAPRTEAKPHTSLSTPVTPSPRPSSTVTQKPSTPSAAVPPSQVKPKPTLPRTIRVKEYTIQVGSFTSLDKAEEAGKLLKEKGLNGQIMVREVGGTRYYRLRIGPYENKAEAEKFLSWVKEIRGFEGSMIFERNGTRTVAN